ncbi:hypothetical protein [Dongshaea marina]|nr:hypothetical protein [Dongshaea marina]
MGCVIAYLNSVLITELLSEPLVDQLKGRGAQLLTAIAVAV